MKRLLFALFAMSLGTGAQADIVHLDDVIIDGSNCVGFDCVNGENFSFDTIRLKENNLRIHFEDTSTSSSFPTTDWRLRANESANGGASEFAIDDASAGTTPFAIEANAPNNAFYISDAGDAGFGTSSPVVDLHAVDGNTPTLRLEQNGSAGFSPQIWDLAGNEANFFVRDVTNGSALPFRIEPGTAENTLYLDSQERVGVGTNAPDSTLHVRRTDGSAKIHIEETIESNFQEILELTHNGFPLFSLTDSSESDSWQLRLSARGGSAFEITKTGTGGPEFYVTEVGNATFTGEVNAVAFNSTSSRALKEQIEPVDSSELLAKLEELPISTWQFSKGGKNARHLGPMAEDFHAAYGLGRDNKHISPADMAGVALASVKELRKSNKELLYQNRVLKKRLDSIQRNQNEYRAELKRLQVLLDE